MNEKSYIRVIYVAFFLSGASALVYEILWSRYLTLIFGSSIIAISVVLASFMAGLASGSIWGGRCADKNASPVKIYIQIEFLIAVYALLLPGILSAMTNFQGFLHRYTADNLLLLTLQRSILSFFILAAPTFLLGATFPVIVKSLAIYININNIGSSVARLYFINILGAVTGSFLAGFILIEKVGLATTNYIAASTNLAIAAILTLFLLNSKGLSVPQLTSAINTESKWVGRNDAYNTQYFRMIFFWTIFFSSLATMAYQVLWTRILILYFTSTIHSFTVILMVYLIALATGSLLSERLIKWVKDRVSFFGAIQSLMGAAALAGLLLSTEVYYWIFRLYPRTENWVEIVIVNSSIAFLLIFPSILFSGVVIPLASAIQIHKIEHTGRRAGQIYFLNCLGAMAGPLLASFFLVPYIGIKTGFKFIAISQMINGAALFLFFPGKPRRVALGMAVVATCVVAQFMVRTGILTQTIGVGNIASTLAILNRDYYRLLHYEEGSATTVSIIQNKTDGSRFLEIDGFIAAGTDQKFEYMKMIGHLPMLFHSNPRRVLVVGAGTGITAGSMLAHPVQAMTIAEIDPVVISSLEYFEEENNGLAKDERVKIIHEDGRNHLLTTDDHYDVIALEPLPPYFAGMTNLYSKEFYEISRDRLDAGGIVCQWLPLHLVSPELLRMMVKTFRESFEDVLIWLQPNSPIAIMMGSNTEMEIRHATFAAALDHPKIKQDLKKSGIERLWDLADNFVMNGRLIDEYLFDEKLITDDRPYLEFVGPRVMSYGKSAIFGKENRSEMVHYKVYMTPKLLNNGHEMLISFD